jgi:hypothetical protein
MRLNHSYQKCTRRVGRVLVTRQKNVQGIAEVAEPELHWVFMKQPEFQKKATDVLEGAEPELPKKDWASWKR